MGRKNRQKQGVELGPGPGMSCGHNPHSVREPRETSRVNKPEGLGLDRKVSAFLPH